MYHTSLLISHRLTRFDGMNIEVGGRCLFCGGAGLGFSGLNGRLVPAQAPRGVGHLAGTAGEAVRCGVVAASFDAAVA